MPTVKQVALPFPYTGTVRMWGGRCQSRSLYDWTMVSIPVVDAPVVLQAHGVSDGR